VIPELEVADSPLRLVGQVLVSPGLARCSVGTLPLLWVAGDRAIVEQDEIQKSSPVAGCLEILSMPRACGRTSVLVDDMHPACSTAEWANFAFVIDLRDTALLPVGDDGGCYLESKKCYIVPAPADSSVPGGPPSASDLADAPPDGPPDGSSNDGGNEDGGGNQNG
jgi:hypothetical protein